MWKELMSFWNSDNLLKQAWEQSFDMLEIDHKMFKEAIIVLRNKLDNEFDNDVIEQDKIVNRYEQEVRKKVMTHCSVHPASSLAEGFVLVSIVIDIERIGDYMKNIVRLAADHPGMLKGRQLEENLQKIENAVNQTFTLTRKFLESSNAESALQYIKETDWLPPLCDESILKLLAEDDPGLEAGNAATLVLYFRWLKRIYAHLRNILTSLINPFDKIGFKPKKKYLKR